MSVIGQNRMISTGNGPEVSDALGEGSIPVSSTAIMPKRLLVKDKV